jgi:hypothetical protein
VGGEYVSLQMLTNCRAISAFKSIDPSTIEDTQGKPYDLPFGLIDFRAEVDRPGDFAEVVVYLSQPAPPGAKWYMYDEASGWRVYPHAAFSEDRMNVTVRLKDGDREYGDADGVANGIIIDPSGLGVGGDSEGSMCFITATTVDDSPFSLWAAMLLVLMVLVMTGKKITPRGGNVPALDAHDPSPCSSGRGPLAVRNDAYPSERPLIRWLSPEALLKATILQGVFVHQDL